jgi:hypothetical protein
MQGHGSGVTCEPSTMKFARPARTHTLDVWRAGQVGGSERPKNGANKAARAGRDGPEEPGGIQLRVLDRTTYIGTPILTLASGAVLQGVIRMTGGHAVHQGRRQGTSFNAASSVQLSLITSSAHGLAAVSPPRCRAASPARSPAAGGHAGQRVPHPPPSSLFCTAMYQS